MGSSPFPPPSPPSASPTSTAPSGPARSRRALPLVIAAVVVAVAAVGVTVVAHSRNGGGSSVETVLGTEPAPSSSVEGTEPPATDAGTDQTAPIVESGVKVVQDDSGTFTVLLLDTFATDTTQFENAAGSFARVTGAADLAAFERDTDHDTFGISVLVGDAATLPAPAELVTAFDPGAAACPDRSTKSGYDTTNGVAEVLLIDGCGTGGAFASVVMAIAVPAQQSVIVLVAKGPGPSNTDLLDFAQAVGESVVIGR